MVLTNLTDADLSGADLSRNPLLIGSMVLTLVRHLAYTY